MRYHYRALLLAVTIGVFTGLYFTQSLEAQEAAASIWQIQHPPFNKTIGLALNAISAQSDQNVWAVGNGSAHWDGKSWTLIPIVRHDSLNLVGVAALAPTNVWAVGSLVTKGGRTHEAVEQFDGTAWQVIPDVSLIGKNLDGIVKNEALTSISALSSNDIWAAGYIGIEPPCDCIVPFIEHFDGTRWKLSGALLTANSPGHFQFLQGISEISPTDVWAVGYISLNGALNGATQTFHFDGTQWTQVAVPSGQASRLNAVTSVASDNVWAVGEANQKTLVEHFDGKRWSLVKSPNTRDVENRLFGITAVSPNSVWAVGDHFQSFGKSLVLHFDGSNWSINPSPSEGKDSFGTILFAASSLPSGHVWAAGNFLGKQLPPLRPFVLFTDQGR